MQITKIVNNNIVISEDKNHKEVVLMGKGLGFQKHKGDEIKLSQIEKTYVMKDHGMTQRFQEMLTDIPIERVKICNKIIQYAKDTLQKNINDNIYVSLTDHINFAIERYQKKMMFSNPLFREVRTFYREEYLIGTFALDLIKRRLGISFPADEAASIALHIVNAEYNTRMRDTIDMTKIIQDVLQLVGEYFHIEPDENSTSYERMITHLRFLAHRIYSGELLEDGADLEEFHAMIRQMYPEEYACSRKVKEFIWQTYGHEVSEEEVAYLSVHIRRVRNSSRPA